MIEVERKHSIKTEIIKIENKGRSCELNTYLAIQNPVVLPTVPEEPLVFLTNVSEIIKIYGPTEIRARAYCLRYLCPRSTAETFYLKSRQNYTEKKDERLNRMNNFS